ncbi:caspase domain-containing protein [Actinoplanes sp. NPDC051513]|uniref:caspase domain-containing protein n=1 Tax=Actinoplanes sp. NPDC051513 TaxID=3363908 RepID=UPI0037AFCD52
MSRLYALLAGIDTYRAVSPLSGCRNDVRTALAYLRSRSDDLHALELYDDKATRAAVVGGIRQHLGRARAGDTALFWFAGHGSLAPVPSELDLLEPSGWLQTLVCADSRDGAVPDLYDKELSVLLDQVAASGCHVAVVLDSCHSSGAVRGEVPEAVARTRRVPPPARRPRSDELIPELRRGWTLPVRSRLVALTACRSDQVANELPLEGETHGVFSWALLRALNQLGPGATYRELLAAARCAVEDQVRFQVPQLAGDAPADQPFLGGTLRRPASRITMRHLAGRWEIDAGSCHGVPAGPSRVAVAGDGPVRPARVLSVQVDRSTVVPEDWSADPARQYPVVFTELPQPALAIAVDGPVEASAAVAGRAAGSPYLRVAALSEPIVPGLRFRLSAPARARILGADGDELAPEVVAEGLPQLAETAVRAGEHIARWRQVHALTNPASALAGAVRLEIVPAHPGERTAPLDRPALAPDDDGLIRLRYRRENGAWVGPTVFVLLRNTTGRPLYCVLLDLTGRYRIHAGLFPGEFVGAHRTGAAIGGRPVRFRLPDGATPAPGAQVRDWLKLIVAEDEFGGRPFEQEALGEPGRRGALPRVRMTRDAGASDPDDLYDWATSAIGVLTEVPA